MNENVKTIYKRLQNTKKATLKEKFMMMCAYVKVTEISPINNVMRHWTARVNKNKHYLDTVAEKRSSHIGLKGMKWK